MKNFFKYFKIGLVVRKNLQWMQLKELKLENIGIFYLKESF